jgi:exosortase/archaeosortase family protein
MSTSHARICAFLALFAAMYFALAQAWGDGLSHWVIDEMTVRPAAWLARAFTGDTAIVADGPHLRAPGVSMNVLFGCEGTDVLMLLAAAVLVAPVRWRDRLIGLLAGWILVFVLNQARVLGLFFALRWHRGWFGPLHGLIGPLVVVLGVTAFFIAWLQWSSRHPHPHSQPYGT